jgi:hypothetical protein
MGVLVRFELLKRRWQEFAEIEPTIDSASRFFAEPV